MSRAWQQLKNIYHYGQAHFWRAWYRWPDRELTIVGVTGTNGKTTTAIVLGSILRAAYGKQKVGLLSTEVFWFGDREEDNKTHMTSTDARLVYRRLRHMRDQGVEQVVIELTSHALDQHRLAGLALRGAILTNITHEHLDYHGSMSAYARAKARLARYLLPGSSLVMKQGDEWTDRLAKTLKARGPDPALVFFTSEQARLVVTALPGDFNKENVLAARLLAKELGIAEADINRGVQSVEQIPGRVEWVACPRPCPRHGQTCPVEPWRSGVLIDFALTPDALQKLYHYLRAEVAGNLIAVFGAAGRRDRLKRPLIAKVIAEYADEIVLTQDEPYDEPEEIIYNELEAGLKGLRLPWRRIEDRREAIRYALQKARPGDAVVVTGMGNYTTRVVGSEQVAWSDRQVILELISELSSS